MIWYDKVSYDTRKVLYVFHIKKYSRVKTRYKSTLRTYIKRISQTKAIEQTQGRLHTRVKASSPMDALGLFPRGLPR